MKNCKNCGKDKPLQEFNFRNLSKGTRSSNCKICSRRFVRNHYYKNRLYYIKKAKERNKARRLEIKKWVWSYLNNNSCVDCGENDPIVLEFDHMFDKISAISRMHRNFSLNAVIKEIEKCQIRCANCHRRKTAKERGWHQKVKPL